MDQVATARWLTMILVRHDKLNSTLASCTMPATMK